MSIELNFGDSKVEDLLDERRFRLKWNLEKNTPVELARAYRKDHKSGLIGNVVLICWDGKFWFGRNTVPKLATVTGYARKWGVGRPTVYRWIAKKKLIVSYKKIVPVLDRIYYLDPNRRPPKKKLRNLGDHQTKKGRGGERHGPNS